MNAFSKRIRFYIAQGEGLSVEFKETYTPKISQDIVAFANSKGGVILLGIKDNGNIIGIQLTNKLKAEIIDLARNCNTSITVSVKEEHKIIVISVPEGQEKPYSCSSGYFKRFDAVTQKMNYREIKTLYEDGIDRSFEERINLDFKQKDISEIKVKNFLAE